MAYSRFLRHRHAGPSRARRPQTPKSHLSLHEFLDLHVYLHFLTRRTDDFAFLTLRGRYVTNAV
jgi:hypothetical protein